MESNFERALWLLAATGWSEKVLTELLYELQSRPATEVMRELRRVRATLKRARSSTLRKAGDEAHARALPKNAVRRALDLLEPLPGLATAEKAELVKNSIESTGNAKGIRSFAEKEGLRAWMDHVAAQIGPAELLHHATTVRNTLVHKRPSAWTLRDDNAK